MSLLDQLDHFVDILPLRAPIGKRLPRHPNGKRQTVDHITRRGEDIPFESSADPARQFILVKGPDGLALWSGIDGREDQSHGVVDTHRLGESEIRVSQFGGRHHCACQEIAAVEGWKGIVVGLDGREGRRRAYFARRAIGIFIHPGLLPLEEAGGQVCDAVPYRRLLDRFLVRTEPRSQDSRGQLVG